MVCNMTPTFGPSSCGTALLLLPLNAWRCWLQDAAETREAFAALKSQFVAHHDMLDAKERELVRRDCKVSPLDTITNTTLVRKR